ncbi:hypothetical protein LEMLEM_LOCUS21249, partial [Lemmus lemmus]
GKKATDTGFFSDHGLLKRCLVEGELEVRGPEGGWSRAYIQAVRACSVRGTLGRQ